jgi:NAD(P)-dependent dehydrogenase (short-subunit alcohol dehydrogenase family)
MQLLLELKQNRNARPAPIELSQQVDRVLGSREIRRNIDLLQVAGAEVVYRSLDIADEVATAAAVAEIRAIWGRVDGIVHGAGVLADKLIAEQSDEQFEKVFRTKVLGLHSLLASTRQDQLKLICLFSSVAARRGNSGQAAYSAANEVLNKVARTEAIRRGGACLVRSLNWGPWDAGMVTPGIRQIFAERGISVISPEVGAQAFAAELSASAPTGHDFTEVEVTIGGAAPDKAGGDVEEHQLTATA